MPETQYSLSEKQNLKQPILSDKERFALYQQSIKNPSLDTITSSVHNSSEIIRTQLPNNNRHLFDTSSNSPITPNTASPISSILFHSQNDTPQIPPSSLHDPLHSVTSSFPINAKIELYTHTSSLNPVTVSFSLSPNSKEPQRYSPSLHSPLNPIADSFPLSPNSKPQRYNSSLHPPLNPVADSFPLSPNSKEPQRYNPSLHSPLNSVVRSFPLNPNNKFHKHHFTTHSVGSVTSKVKKSYISSVLKRQTAQRYKSFFINRQSSEDTTTSEQAASLVSQKFIQSGHYLLRKEIRKNTILSSVLHSNTSLFIKPHSKQSFSHSSFTPRTTSERLKVKIFHTKHHAYSTYHSGKKIFFAAKKLFSNPVVLKISVVFCSCLIIMILFFSVISAVVGTVSGFSLKSDSQTLSDTYLYITQLDAELENKILTEDTKVHIPAIDVYRYFHNGTEVTKESISAVTDADLLLAYLDSKYQEYTFAEVKSEIDTIHSFLYHITPIYWTEEQVHEVPTYDPVTGEIIIVPQIQQIQHLDLYVISSSWEDYYTQNKDSLLNPEQQQQYDALKEIGVYTFSQQLSTPFPHVDWSKGVSSRWGWRIHPISKSLEQHLGLDIAMPANTPIHACHSGVVVTANDPDGWGNYIKVVQPNGDYTLYGHMMAFAVENGQTVSSGDVIGFVGSTGMSTGNHLHLEYHKQGKNLNPLIFTECEVS